MSLGILSPGDVSGLSGLVQEFVRRDQDSLLRTNGFEQFDSPEIYVALLPCGKTLPARSGVTPGKEKCCIFKVTNWDTASPSLINILAEDAQGGSIDLSAVPEGQRHYREIVYNIYPVAIPARIPPNDSQFFIVQRDKFGRWFCEIPPDVAVYAGLAGGTTRNPNTPATTTPPPCYGKCKWSWIQSSNRWYLDTDGCSANKPSTTSTTSTSSSTTSATTTLPNCLCPIEITTSAPTDTSTSTSTSSSTTTENPCECLYPTFCGTETGQCTITDCSTAEQPASEIDPACSTTTTVDCSGYTTTVAPTDDPCVYECVGPYHWQYVSGSCAGKTAPSGDCECGEQALGGGGGGGPIGPPSPNCSGGQSWFWNHLIEAWVWYLGTCNYYYSCPDGTSGPCVAEPPSRSGDLCETYSTPCRCVGPGTTRNPCEPTTSSTTTTLNPCQTERCVWEWISASWQKQSDDCPSDCPCVPPVDEGNECDLQATYCAGRTTTSSTTTTKAWWCVYFNAGPLSGTSGCTQVTTTYPVVSGPYISNNACIAATCAPTTTSLPWWCSTGAHGGGSCTQNTTVPPGGTGPFVSPTECESFCATTVGWYCCAFGDNPETPLIDPQVGCVNRPCANNPPFEEGLSGPYPTQTACQSVCAPTTTQGWWCLADWSGSTFNGCLKAAEPPPGAASGPYALEFDCQTSCQFWWCTDPGVCQQGYGEGGGVGGGGFAYETEEDCLSSPGCEAPCDCDPTPPYTGCIHECQGPSFGNYYWVNIESCSGADCRSVGANWQFGCPSGSAGTVAIFGYCSAGQLGQTTVYPCQCEP